MKAAQPVLIDGDWRAADVVDTFRAEDPARAVAIGAHYPVSGARDLERALAAASSAAEALVQVPAWRIAAFLDAYADAIDANAAELVDLAHAETALPVSPRLADNELPRTSNQLRQAAAAARSYAWTLPTIDTKTGLRSHFAPLGKPAVVFGPNNFPLAFNAVAGSDFASAIAARNPVVAKAHPLHPATSQRLAELAHEAVLATELPAASVQMLYHVPEALGPALCRDRRVGAVGFTGSRGGGLALKRAADEAGVAFYGEMSSINPVFLLPGALGERGAALALEFFTSCTLGSGQFCTNPGLVVVPRGEAGDAFIAAAAAHFDGAAPGVLFSRGVLKNVQSGIARWREAGATRLGGSEGADGAGYRFAPVLFGVDGAGFLRAPAALQSEAFGPASLVVRCDGIGEMLAVAHALEANLTGTLYVAADGSDDEAASRLANVLRPRVGRLIENHMPTGVAVSPAMQHGGPYPSASHAGFTSVGMPAAIRRFAALHGYDRVPDARLPPELRDRNPGGIARLVDGVWTTADVL
ncbi:MAG TPA: aldehyde dehydrogenase family protein [Rudaea sp.]|nr:aldehyde dehydrogenase family protein [Rudaea sp.]